MGSVSCSDDIYTVAPVSNPVELGQHGIYDPGGRLGHGASVGSVRDQRVELIKEDYHGHRRSRTREYLPDCTFALAYIFVEQFRAFDRDEVLLALVCNSFRQESFAATRRTPQQQAGRW